MTPHYLLDTNVLVHFVRDDATWQKLRPYGLLALTPRPAISVVTLGEIEAFAERNGWGKKKRTPLGFFIGLVDHIDIAGPAIYARYAFIDNESYSAGKTMGKNDIWIAATAGVYGFRLLTTDKDFHHLAPQHLDLEYVAQVP